MKKFAVTAALVLAAIATPADAPAAGLSLFSGRTLGHGDALNFSAGIPDASLLYLTPYAGDADWGGFLKLGYATPVGTHWDNVWLAFGGVYKKNIRNGAKYNLGFQIDFGPAMWLSPEFMPGLMVGPSMIFGVPLKDVATLNFGFGVPFMMTFKDGVLVQIPIGFKMGGEFFIDPMLTVNMNLELGPGIQTVSHKNGSTTDTDVYALFKFGISFGL